MRLVFLAKANRFSPKFSHSIIRLAPSIVRSLFYSVRSGASKASGLSGPKNERTRLGASLFKNRKINEFHVVGTWLDVDYVICCYSEK